MNSAVFRRPGISDSYSGNNSTHATAIKVGTLPAESRENIQHQRRKEREREKKNLNAILVRMAI